MRADWWRQMAEQFIGRETAAASQRRMWCVLLRTPGQGWYWLRTRLPELWNFRSPGAVEAEPAAAVDVRAEERLGEALAGQVAQAAQAAAREAHREAPVELRAVPKEELPVAVPAAEGCGPSTRHITLTTTIRIPPQGRSFRRFQLRWSPISKYCRLWPKAQVALRR